MDYMLVAEPSLAELVDKVQTRLREGWSVFGDVVVYQGEKTLFIQAIIKEASKQKDAEILHDLKKFLVGLERRNAILASLEKDMKDIASYLKRSK